MVRGRFLKITKQVTKYLLGALPRNFSNHLYYSHPEHKKFAYSCPSFSQEGEDMVLRRLFPEQNTGFFIDIGAHHPSHFSNTKYFYDLGWRGINIEPSPGSKTIFEKERIFDINLEVLISEESNEVNFHLFDPPLMNTMSDAQLAENKKFDWCIFLKTVKVKSEPLKAIISNYVPTNQKIDFISIDVEGAELSVLKSHNWDYRPKVIVIEVIDKSISEIFETDVYKFLFEKNYSFFAKTGNSIFFKTTGFFEF
ncbi:MAG: FkbM family methyltransferase [Sphingobacteriaceae bacterium]|nr:FkbM family methyltransferase [Sphingobacteriaceae bacterium]